MMTADFKILLRPLDLAIRIFVLEGRFFLWTTQTEGRGLDGALVTNVNGMRASEIFDPEIMIPASR